MPREIFSHLTHAQVDAVLTVLLGLCVVAALGSTVCFWLAYRPRNSRNVQPTDGQIVRAVQAEVEFERRRLAGLAAVPPAALVQAARPTDDATTETEFAFFETSWGENGRVM